MNFDPSSPNARRHLELAQALALLEQRQAVEAQEQSLIDFVRWNWATLEPDRPLVEGWALDAICEHLEAVTNGEIPRLLINVPPGFMKSLLVNVFHPAWEWGPRNLPGMRYVNFSYSSSLTERDNTRFRDLMMDPRYSGLWKDRFTLRKIGETKVTNDKTGWKLASSVGGVATGERGDRIILDDPHNVKEGESEVVRSETVRWFRESMSNRLNDMDTGSIVVIMQRVHDADVSGVIIGDGLGYEHLMIPMEFDQRRVCTTGIGWEDPREYDGELAWKERFSGDVVERLKTTLGTYAFASQYQQAPTPRGGGIIKEHYWRLYPPDGEAFDERTGEPLAPLSYPPFDYVLVSVDTALTAKEENDWSACTCWGVYRNDNDMIRVLLIHAWQARLEFHDLVDRVILTGRGMDKKTRRDGSTYEVNLGWHADTVLIENKANGLSVVQEMARLCRGEEFSIKTFDPKRDGGGDIVARAHSVEAMFEAGLVEAPDRDWANLVIDEVAAVPKGAHDDLASSAFQALKWLRSRSILLMRSEREDQLTRELSPKAMRPMGKPYDV